MFRVPPRRMVSSAAEADEKIKQAVATRATQVRIVMASVNANHLHNPQPDVTVSAHETSARR